MNGALGTAAQPIRNIVFSGGAMGGIALAGAWTAIEELHMDRDIVNFAGCSIGGLFALLISIGYSGRELATICKTFRYKDHADLQFLSVLDNLGIESATGLMDLLQTLVQRKVGRRDLSFLEHWQITGKHLWINASCLELDQCHYFSVNTDPFMSVVKAVRMSISLPIVFTAVKHHGYTYIDGGFHDPFPVTLFSADETVGVKLVNIFDPALPASLDHPFLQYVTWILTSLYRRFMAKSYKEYTVIEILTGISTLAVNLTRKERKRIIHVGYTSVKAYSSHSAVIQQSFSSHSAVIHKS